MNGKQVIGLFVIAALLCGAGFFFFGSRGSTISSAKRGEEHGDPGRAGIPLTPCGRKSPD